MKKNLRYFMTLLLIAVASAAWGAEEVYITLDFANATGESSNYTSTWTATAADDTEFTMENFNRNTTNGQWNYVKCGRKNNASVGTITTFDAIDEAITKVVVTIDAITASKVNSIKLYTSSDGSSWTAAGDFTKSTGTQAVTLASPAEDLYYKVEFDCASGSSNGLVTVSKVEYYYNTSGADAPTISAENLEIAYDATSGAIEYTINNEPSPAGILTASTTSDWLILGTVGTTVPFTCSTNGTGAARTATVTLTYTFSTDETVTADVTVTQALNPNGPGTENNPYTVAEVLALFENDEVPTSKVYVKGTISSIKSLEVPKYKRAQYYISDNGTEENQFYVYNGYYLNGADFTANDQIKVGDKVVIYGKLITYNGTNEFEADNYIVSLEYGGKAPAELSYAKASVTKYVGDADFTNALTNNHNLSISYSSSVPTVATVDENGLVSILAAGTTIITATSEESEEYEVGEASYTLTVEEKEAEENLVTVDDDGITFDLTENGWGFPEGSANKATEIAEFRNSDYIITLGATTAYYFNTDGYLILGKAGSTLTLPAFDFDVEKIEVVGRSGASSSVVQNIFVGETAVSTATTGSTGTNTYEIDADYQAAGNIYTLKVTSAHNTQITSIKVYKKQATATESVPVNQHGKGTYVTTNALDFTGITTVTAYVATAQNGSDVTFDPVTKVPAGTPLLVKGATTDVPVIASAEEIGTNFLVAGSGEGVASVAGGKYNFILNYLNGAVGFYRAAENTVAKDRAYLSLDSDIPTGSAKVNLIFSDEATGINNVNAVENTNEKVYNLAGQQMKSAVKGVYIKNGKKYVK